MKRDELFNPKPEFIYIDSQIIILFFCKIEMGFFSKLFSFFGFISVVFLSETF